MTEYEDEPIRGLPGLLPADEQILWQGAPDWPTLARRAFHTRLVAAYFALLVGWAIVSAITTRSSYVGVEMTFALGLTGLALLHLLAWGAARTTVYTVTNRRIVLRIGMAVPKCINLPLVMIGAVDVAATGDGRGDVPLVMTGPAKLGLLTLWPHVRPWTFRKPRPMLRAIGDARAVAGLIATACRAAQEPAARSSGSPLPAERPQPASSFAEAAAA